MTSPSLDELLLRKVIRGDKGHEVYNKMTNEELKLQEDERRVIRFKDNTIHEISQDVDFCILYDVFKLGDEQKIEAKRKFLRDSYSLHELKQKRLQLLKHVNLIYQKPDMLPTGNDRNYVQSVFEQVKTIDADIKAIHCIIQIGRD